MANVRLIVLHLLRFLVWSIASVTAVTALAADVEYTYDEAGRLVGVYAPSGDAAQYVYDAAGNITQIKRFTASQLSIIEFSPNAGPVGAQVVIFGTGFSATPASNTVTFNGTAAAVSAATINRLTVTVPAGATTGAIGVTVGANNVTSSSNFTVIAAAAAPTISGFSPTSGTPGTSVTISGTNFDTTAALDDVTFNSTYALVSAATSTAITTTVPANAASGPIKVRTINGTATSSSDFIVPFGSYALGDIASTGRIVIDGSAVSYSIATAGKVAMLLFDGVQGQNLGIAITGITYTPSGGNTTVHVRRPDNAQLLASISITGATTIDLPTLPLTGVYTIAVVPGATYKMDGTVTLSADSTAPLASEGAIANLSNTRAGQNGRHTLFAQAGQKVAAYVYSITSGIQPVRIDLVSPSGAVVATSSSTSSSAFIQAQTVALTGTYAVLVSPTGTGTGSWSAQYGVPDLAITAYTLGTPAINQNGSYGIPFSATIANQGTVGAKGVSWYDYSYLSVDSALDTSDASAGYTTRFSDIASGANYVINGTATTATTTTAGSYTLFFKADGWEGSGLYSTAAEKLTESNENNNTASNPVTLLGRPDLSVSNFTTGTITVAQNGAYNIPLSFTVTNGGASSAQPSWYDYVFISTDGTLDGSDPTLGYATRSTALGPSSNYVVSTTMPSTTSLPPGNYTLFVRADGYLSGALAETNESNNTASVAVTVPGRPDLTVTALSTGTISRNGNGSYNIPLTFTVKNVGETTAKASWNDSCYLSTDATLDTSDNYMAYENRSTDLAPNAEYTVSKTCVTPTTTTPGNYYLIVKADVYGSGTHYSALVEASETNNAMSLAVVLLP